ncbi:MAG: hypothetical protein WCI71_19115, partial [Bacteroidota bacterium]
MKKYNHPIDDFFRENLKDHQMAPSDAAKQAFLKEALHMHPPIKKGRNGLFLLSVLLVLVSTGIIIWTITSDNTTAVTNKSVTRPVLITKPENQATGANYKRNSETKKRTSPLQTEPIQHTEKSQNQVAEQPPIVTVTEQQPVSNVFTSGISSTENSLQKIVKTINPGVTDSMNSETPVTPYSGTVTAITIQHSTTAPYSSEAEVARDAAGRHKPWIPSIGVYYTPEWMFNTLDGTKLVNNFGLEGIFYFKTFSVRTGAGLSIAKGTNELMVEYNDYLGGYNKLDSMQFTWNDPAHEYIPKYYMSHEDVWDSLLKSDYPKVVKRFTYLQIPVILGYEVWQTETFSVGVRAGPVLSILLASKNLSADYDPGSKRVYSFNDIAPGQVNLNWQLLGGLNVSVRLNRMSRIEIEPDARYYFNSVYEKLVNKTKPWSVGIRAACI